MACLRARLVGCSNLACEMLLEGQAEALTQKAIQMALDGDAVALRLCLDPQRIDRVAFPLPPIASARDAVARRWSNTGFLLN